jgi:hypothetical protein
LPDRSPHRPVRAALPHTVPRYPIRFHRLLAVRITRQLTRPTGASLGYPVTCCWPLLRRLVGSMSFPSFCPTTHDTRLRLPSSGSFGPHFPTFTGTMLRYDSRLPFSVSCALARSPIPGLFLLFVSFLQARCRSGTLAPTPGLLGHPVRLFRGSDQETDGPPKFPGYPFEDMPRS